MERTAVLVYEDFVANASHELRSPLTVISGYLESLSHAATLDRNLQGPVAEMRMQVERMNGIIQDLLALCQLGTTECAADHMIDVAALMHRLRKDVLARPNHPRQVWVRAESGSGLLGAPSEVCSAFTNLVDNAAKYTPVHGSIELRWWTDRQGGHFCVIDTGTGIAAEHLPRLTERFFRADAGRLHPTTTGSGLGLAIVKRIVERHDAQLTITSRQGLGSTFAIHFPACRVVTFSRGAPGRSHVSGGQASSPGNGLAALGCP